MPESGVGVELPKSFDRPIPESVPEPIRVRSVDQENRANWLLKVNEELHHDLDLAKHLPEADIDQVEGLYNQIALSMVESAEELHIPIPRTTTTVSWGYYQTQKKRGDVGKEDASVSQDEYAIKFNPAKIEELLKFKPFTRQIESDLTIRHEMLHFWEMIHEPAVYTETMEKLDQLRIGRPEVYEEVKQGLTGKEMRAKMIELDVLKNEDTKTVRQFLLKSFLILVTKAELIQRAKRRKELGITF